MKKLWFVLTLMAVLAIFMVGCDKQETPKNDATVEDGGSQTENNGGNQTENNGGNNDTEKTPEELPTLAEIIELNQLENVFKAHSNAYVYVVYFEEGYEYTEDMIFVNGDGKADYHERTKYADSEEYVYTSGVGNVRYRVSEFNTIIWEIGEPLFSGVSYLEMDDAIQVGKGYIENDKIVYHAYQIVEGFDEIPTYRYDYTFYFNKDTKLIERLDYVGYGSDHKACCEYRSETSYSVDIESKLGTTAYEIMNSSEYMIELEVIKGYNTPEQSSYTMTVPYDADITLSIYDEYYALFSDVECTNYVSTLEDFIGEEKVTLYAVAYSDFEEIRYTVTEEEWNSYTEEYNFTVEKIVDGEREFLHKYTEDVLDLDGDIILFVDDSQYCLEETEDGWVAYDCTFINFVNDGLFTDTPFDDYFFDESIFAYVNKDYEESGIRYEIRFENGVPVSATTIVLDDENEPISQLVFTNVGKTTINVPDFTFYYDLEADPAKLATEELWNSYVGEKNFVAHLVTFIDGEDGEYILKSTDEAFELDGKIIVSEADKKYALEEIDGVWYAVEYDGVSLPESILPEGLNFSDFEYDKQQEMYVQKDTEGAEYIYSVAFDNGALACVQILKAADPSNPLAVEAIALMISEIGTAEIDVPEYVMGDAA